MSLKAPASTKTVRVPDPSRLRVGARIFHKRSNWEGLLMPRWTRAVIRKGFKFRFIKEPHQTAPPHQFPLSLEDRATVDSEISLLLARRRNRGWCSSSLP